MTITLSAQSRFKKNPATLRSEELIPAVYYSLGKDAVSIAVPLKDFIKVYKEAGESTAVTLELGGEKISTLIHDIQRDPIKGTPIHVDFLVIDMNKEIEVTVPIEFIGLAEAEKGGIGTVVKVLHEIEIKALPANLPHEVNVDVTNLKTLDDQIHVRDIILPKGVVLVTDEDEVVALVSAFTEEKEEVVTNVDLSTIEVEKKGKKEEEEAVA